MSRTRSLSLALWLAIFLALWNVPARAQEAAARNVVLVLVDGLRWQEVFHGADRALIEHEKGGVEDKAALERAFWREDVAARREALMPFLWRVVAPAGQILGDRDAGCAVDVSNGLKFSYPGYSEMLVGFPDARIASNDKVPNPNVTVLEFLHGRPGFAGQVAAIGVWDVVPSIVNRERCGFFVSAAFEPITVPPVSAEQALLNRLKTDLPRQWDSMPPDAIGFRSMLEYWKAHAPRVLYFTFGETDEFAHEGRYDRYLQAAQRTDAAIRELWETLQHASSRNASALHARFAIRIPNGKPFSPARGQGLGIRGGVPTRERFPIGPNGRLSPWRLVVAGPMSGRICCRAVSMSHSVTPTRTKSTTPMSPGSRIGCRCRPRATKCTSAHPGPSTRRSSRPVLPIPSWQFAWPSPASTISRRARHRGSTAKPVPPPSLASPLDPSAAPATC